MPSQFVVGGAVRDVLLGISPSDIDYVWVDSPDSHMKSLGFVQVGISFPVYLDQQGQEHALARQETKTGIGYTGFACTTENVSLIDDLRRRDLTINSMAVNVADWDEFVKSADSVYVIDPYNGQTDLATGILRHVSEAFGEDCVRVLRAARFAARYGFEIHEDTLKLMGKIAHELDSVPKERIWAEFEKGLMEKYSTKMGDALWKSGAMAASKALHPYKGFGLREEFLPSDSLISRFIASGSAFQQHDFEEYRIPTDIVRVFKAVSECNVKLSVWCYVSIDERVKTMQQLRAFNDTTLLNQVFDVLDIFHRLQKIPLEWTQAMRFRAMEDVKVAKSVDTEAIAKMAPTPKQIGPLIFAARCEALEQSPESRQLIHPNS